MQVCQGATIEAQYRRAESVANRRHSYIVAAVRISANILHVGCSGSARSWFW